MYPLSLLIVDLETARRRLRYVVEVPYGTPTTGLKNGPPGLSKSSKVRAKQDLSDQEILAEGICERFDAVYAQFKRS